MNSTKNVLSALLCLGISVKGTARTYVVKDGDTLSDILYKKVPGRIYGPGNSLEKARLLNPNLISVHRVTPGEVLTLPEGIGKYTQFEIARGLAENDNYVESKQVKNEKREKLASKLPMQKVLEKDLHQSFFFGLRLNNESLAATEKQSGEKEISTSDLAYGAFFRWSHKWNGKFDFFFDASISKLKFDVSDGKTLEEDSMTKAYGGVGIRYKLTPSHSFEIGTGLGESFLLNSKTATELKISKVVIPSISVSGNHIFKKFDSGYGLSGFWRLGALLPTSQSGFDTELGNYWSVGTGSFYETGGKTFNISISYGQRSVETDDIEQTNKDISISAGVGFEF